MGIVMTYAYVRSTAQGYKFRSSYDSGLVGGLKQRIPANGRKPKYANGKFDCWLISPQYGEILVDICKDNLDVDLQLPQAKTKRVIEQRIIRVEYVGAVKDRGNGDMVAYGAVAANSFTYNPSLDWSIAFPELVLKEWFTGEKTTHTRPQPTTYYTLLAIKQSASGSEIKSAWRKQMKRYHPDVNSDEDAHEMTMKVNKAYKALSNPQSRKKYDLGLKMVANVGVKANTKQSQFGWQPPIRCGLILCEGYEHVGRFNVEKIMQWIDIVENGKSLVSSWDKATNSLRREWI